MATEHTALLFVEPYNLLGPNGQFQPSGQDVAVVGYFKNDSTNNGWVRRAPHGGDVGSNWSAFKSTFEPSSYHFDHVLANKPGGLSSYDGPCMVHNWRSFYDSDFRAFETGMSTETDLFGFGTTAIAKVLPTNPLSDLPTAVGELLSEGLPAAVGASFLKNRRASASLIAGEYVNVQFGLKPFLADMQAFARSIDKAKRLIDEYSRRAGKKIRRRYEFPTHFETAETISADPWSHHLGGPDQGLYYNMIPLYGGSGGVRTDVTTRRITRWFSGAFTYYLPSSSDIAGKLLRHEAEMRHLFGGLSVDTAWNLLPFSWAADWVTNAGDVIHNIAAFSRDGLVMPYGYVMEFCEFQQTRTVRGAKVGQTVHPDGTPIGTLSLPDISCRFGVEIRRRRRATPFGFGLSESGFTNRQWSIITALGVNRSGLR